MVVAIAPWDYAAKAARLNITPADPRAGTLWFDCALFALAHAARLKLELTADDVWELVGKPPAGTNPSRMNTVLNHGRDAGLIVLDPLERTVPSRRPEAHGKRLGLWISQKYGKAGLKMRGEIV